jgi:hypothetical protein
MNICAACDTPIDGPGLSDRARGLAFHPDCAVERLPHEVAVAIGGLVLFALTPLMSLWAV